MTIPLTFRQLESLRDRELANESGASPLEIWYRSVRDKPVCDFTCCDLCKACRQQIFPESVMPIAIATLRKEPLAGEMYDGELIAAMTFAEKKYWSNHPSQATEVRSIVNSIIRQVDDELRSKLKSLLALVSTSPPADFLVPPFA